MTLKTNEGEWENVINKIFLWQDTVTRISYSCLLSRSNSRRWLRAIRIQAVRAHIKNRFILSIRFVLYERRVWEVRKKIESPPVRDVAPAELQRLEGPLGRRRYVIWQIAHICLINGKMYRASHRCSCARASLADASVASGIFFIYFYHLTCRDYGKAKIWVGETSTALVFVLLIFFFLLRFFSFSAFIFVRNIWSVDKRMICEYVNARENVFLSRAATYQQWFNTSAIKK